MPSDYHPQPIEEKVFYDQVKTSYDQRKGIIHGLAKDSIQNCAGHRNHPKAIGWGTEIELIENENKTVLTFTDWGTTGLTGHIPRDLDHAKILRKSDPDEKFSKILMFLNTGINVTGAAGSQGRGLTVFQHNSSIDKVMFESLRKKGSLGYEDAKYVACARFIDDNGNMQQYDWKVDDNAERFINEHAALKPLSKEGTRITIFEPNEDLIKSIKNGEFSTFIASTWFEYLGLYGAHMDGIFITVDGKRKKVKLEPHWEKYFSGEYASDKQIIEDNIDISFTYEGIRNVKSRISKIAMILSDEDLPEHSRGIIVNRSCMAINQFEPILRDLAIPADSKNKVFGYVKLESSAAQLTNMSLEEMIKIVEDSTHYQLVRTRPVYQKIYNKILETGEAFKVRVGLETRKQAHVERRRKEIAGQAQNTTNQILNNLGVTGGGTGIQPTNFIITLDGIEYPGSNSEVYIGQEIKNIKFRIKNKTANVEDNFKLIIEMVDKHNNHISTIGEQEISIGAYNHKISNNYNINISTDIYGDYNYTKVFLRARLMDRNQDQLAKKLVPIFLGMTPDTPEKIPQVLFEELNIENDNGRVDRGDKIKDIKCIVKNDSDYDWELKLRVALRLATDSEEEILVLKEYGNSFILSPRTEQIFELGDIEFSDEGFGHINEGKMLLKAKLLSSIDQHEKVEDFRLCTKNEKIWFNMDPLGQKGVIKIGHENAGANSPRARVLASNNTKDLLINKDHAHYKIFGDGDEDMERLEYYYSEVGLMHGLLQAWQDGERGPFGIDPNDENTDNNDVIKEIHKAYDIALSNLYGE